MFPRATLLGNVRAYRLEDLGGPEMPSRPHYTWTDNSHSTGFCLRLPAPAYDVDLGLIPECAEERSQGVAVYQNRVRPASSPRIMLRHERAFDLQRGAEHWTRS